jgi:hypothetical protein
LFNASPYDVIGNCQTAASQCHRPSSERISAFGHDKERNVDSRFLTMVSSYLFEAVFCNPAARGEMARLRRASQMPGIGYGNPRRRRKAWMLST